MVSGAFAQVDSVFTSQKIITGDLIGINEKEICIADHPFGKQWIPIDQVERFVTKDGELIIGPGASEENYSNYMERFEPEKPERVLRWLRGDKRK